MQQDQTRNNAGDSAREVRVVFAGSRMLGVFKDEIDAIVDWRVPTPLPGAPKAVLGVVSIRGRMLTVLDAAALLGETAVNPARIVALRGDEQLALAVDREGDVIRSPAELRSATGTRPLILGVIVKGTESIAVLNTGELFSTAMRGRERRQRRL